ncbi:hypothetical protein [Nostoc sp.]|uniref:hypothetical protein n=1 Tax=Nostoc sp. TaxID=1180 RepID=UPI002FFC4AF6
MVNERRRLGKIITANFNTNSWTSVADLANYELANNPEDISLKAAALIRDS